MVPPQGAGFASATDTDSREAHRGHVLVVDDEPVTARAFARMLTAAGYKVATACDGKVAAAALQVDAFDVVVSDLVMPEMDGIEAVANSRICPSERLSVIRIERASRLRRLVS